MQPTGQIVLRNFKNFGGYKFDFLFNFFGNPVALGKAISLDPK